MIRADWDDWRKAPTAKKLAALVAANEALVQKCAGALMGKTDYATESMRDDLLQAGRIGLLRSLDSWRPAKGAFTTLAWRWITKEMQMALKHATPVTCPSGGPRVTQKKQGEAAAFFAKNGRHPTPGELGVSATLIARHEKTIVKFVPVSAAENMANTDDANIEEDIDRQRDMKALKLFLGKLTKVERERFWTGKDDNLTARAKAFVAGKRGTR